MLFIVSSTIVISYILRKVRYVSFDILILIPLFISFITIFLNQSVSFYFAVFSLILFFIGLLKKKIVLARKDLLIVLCNSILPAITFLFNEKLGLQISVILLLCFFYFLLGYVQLINYEGRKDLLSWNYKSIIRGYINEFFYILLFVSLFTSSSFITNKFLDIKITPWLPFFYFFIFWYFNRYLLFSLPIKYLKKPLGYVIYDFLFRKSLIKK